MSRPTDLPAPDVGPSRGHTRAAARLAAILLLPFSVAALWIGVGLLAAPPSPSCMEYCDQAGGGRLFLVIAGLGFLLTAGIWRRHYFFVAVGLCLCMVVLSILVALDVVLLANRGLGVWPDAWLFLGTTAVFGAVAALLAWTLIRPDVEIPTLAPEGDPGP